MEGPLCFQAHGYCLLLSSQYVRWVERTTFPYFTDEKTKPKVAQPF